MQAYKDNQTVSDNNSVMDVAILSVIGDRDDQQDSFGYLLKNVEGIVVICDGMGGHEGGQAAGRLAAERFVKDYDRNYPCINLQEMLMNSAKKCDEKIAGLKNADGSRMNAGSTCVAVVIKKDELYWCSVGDSRAYLLRKEEFVQLTQDQNYGTVLGERLRAGYITKEQFNIESGRSEALISYLGIGNLSLIDYNKQPLKLEKDDKIVIMSDGLYKLVSDEEIKRIVENFRNSSDALQALDMKAKKGSKHKELARDNMTAAIITIK